MINTFDGWDSELYHHGIKGQKWGVRRYQNSDGSLTEAGRKRYGYGSELTKAGEKRFAKEYKKLNRLKRNADVNLQTANYAKYSSRAKKGLATTALLGGAAATNGTIGATFARNKFYNAVNGFNNYNNKIYKERISQIQELSGKKLVDDRFAAAYNEKANILRETAQKQNTNAAIGRYLDTNSALTTALKAATAVSAGYTAYNAVKAAAAKYRMSDVGHSKAVAKAEAQVQKMQKMFGDVKLDEIMKRK